MNKLLSGLALAAAAALPAASAAAVITFDPVEEQGATLSAGDSLAAQGFSVTQLSDAPTLLFAGDLVGAYASNGTPSLYAANHAELALTAPGGSRFSLFDLELGGGNLAFLSDPGSVEPWATEVVLTGLLADGSGPLTLSLGIDQASPGLARFVVGWVDLVELRIAGGGDYSLDNLNLQLVPEPHPPALLLLALAAAGFASLRPRRRR